MRCASCNVILSKKERHLMLNNDFFPALCEICEESYWHDNDEEYIKELYRDIGEDRYSYEERV